VQLIATLATSIVLTNLAIIVLGTQPKGGADHALLAHPSPSAASASPGSDCSFWPRPSSSSGRSTGSWRARARQGHAGDVAEPRACAVVGVDVQRVAMVTFALSAALAAAAAALVSPLFNIFPDMGTTLTLKAFAAVVAGGFGYVNGAIAASFLIGLTEAVAGTTSRTPTRTPSRS
jgi:branched-chain amino acid transport system permease protein